MTRSNRRSFRVAAAMVLAVLSTACATPVKQVDVDTSRIDSRPQASLRCAFRLAVVEDRRPDGDRAGVHGWNALRMRDADVVVREGLMASGFSDSEGTTVSIGLMRLYVTQNLYTGLPVAVYQVQVGEDAPFLVRSQIGSMSWSGDVKAAYRGYTTAMADANRQLIERLNTRCG